MGKALKLGVFIIFIGASLMNSVITNATSLDLGTSNYFNSILPVNKNFKSQFDLNIEINKGLLMASRTSYNLSNRPNYSLFQMKSYIGNTPYNHWYKINIKINQVDKMPIYSIKSIEEIDKKTFIENTFEGLKFKSYSDIKKISESILILNSSLNIGFFDEAICSPNKVKYYCKMGNRIGISKDIYFKNNLAGTIYYSGGYYYIKNINYKEW